MTVLDLLPRAALDVVALLVLTAGLYVRRHAARELLMVFASFNLGLFAALSAITDGDFPAGVGFGLFGVLSIVRLRSQEFSPAEVAYFFLSLVLALVTGLPDRDLVLAATLCAALLLAVFLADHPALHPDLTSARLVLDRAYRDDEVLHRAVTERLGGEVVEVRLLEVDEVRDTTRVVARYRRPGGRRSAEVAAPVDEGAR